MLEQKIIDEIEKLPSMPETLYKLQSLKNDETRNVEKLTKIVETDPSIVANLLKTAKSPLYGFTQKIEKVSVVIGLFGVDTVINIVLYDMVKKNFDFNLKPYGITETEYSESIKRRMFLVNKWISKIDLDISKDILFSSIFYDLGKLIASQVLLKSGKVDEFKLYIQEGESIEVTEKKILGTFSEEITIKMLEKMGLEEENYKYIKYINSPNLAPNGCKKEAILLYIIKKVIGYKIDLDKNKLTKIEKFIEEKNLKVEVFNEVLEKILENK